MSPNPKPEVDLQRCDLYLEKNRYHVTQPWMVRFGDLDEIR